MIELYLVGGQIAIKFKTVEHLLDTMQFLCRWRLVMGQELTLIWIAGSSIGSKFASEMLRQAMESSWQRPPVESN